MVNVEVKYDTDPHNGETWPQWDDFERRLMDIAAKHTDECGWSLADCFLGVDAGGAAVGAPGLFAGPAPNAQQRKETQSAIVIGKTESVLPQVWMCGWGTSRST